MGELFHIYTFVGEWLRTYALTYPNTMISSKIRCGYCIFWQLLFKTYFEIVKDLISKYSACNWKQCYFQCNGPHQPMNILWPKSIYYKFGKQTNPYISTRMHVSNIFWQLLFEDDQYFHKMKYPHIKDTIWNSRDHNNQYIFAHSNMSIACLA